MVIALEIKVGRLERFPELLKALSLGAGELE
jgi:hypothetical protein